MALAKRSLDTDLMPPPPPPKRIKRPAKVLDEDKYTAALSHIIARDFFPGLLETETQEEYLDALDAGDRTWIREAGQKLRQAMTPGRQTGRRGASMTPRTRLSGADTPVNLRGQTPSATPASTRSSPADASSKEDEIDHNLSLSAFQAKYTSEDNESFNSVLDRQNELKASKYRWLYNNNKLPSKQLLLQAKITQKKLQAASDSSATESALILRPSQDPNDRPAMIFAPPSSLAPTSQGPRNGFMFFPQDLTDSQPQHTTIADEAQARSLAPPRAVTYAATRLPNSLQTDSSTGADDDDTASLSLTAIDAAIRGRPRRQDLGSLAGPSDSDAGAGGETPRVNGYAFVDAEPTDAELRIARGELAAPRADDDEDKEDDLLQQLITNAAFSSSGSSGPNPFTITTQTPREALHHRLVDKQLASVRKSAAPLAHPQLGRTATPKFLSSPRVGSLGDMGGAGAAGGGRTPGGGRRGRDGYGGLTPAAKVLYSKLGSGKGGGGGSGSGNASAQRLDGSAFDSGEGGGARKGAWTPTPLVKKRPG